MKKVIITLLLLLSAGLISAQDKQDQSKRNYAKQVKKTEKKLQKLAKHQSEFQKSEKNKTPDLYWIQEFIATMDPALGRPTPEVLLEVLEKLNSESRTVYSAMPGTNVTPWTERGPNNVGGRTRALVWDPIDPQGKKVWAGGITGGLWYNSDITSASSSWQHVSGLWANLSVSAIAFDPNAPGTMYVGTGEGYGASSSTSRGYGIWKSTDSGKTFTHMSNTATYYYVNDIIVRNESGSSVVYAAVDANYTGGQFHGTSSYGVFRSTNGGSTFTNITPNAPNGARYAFADLELSADNSLYGGTRNNAFTGTDKGGGRVMKFVSGSTWTTLYTNTNKGRVEIACAPGSASLIYAVFEAGMQSDTLLVTHNSGATWTSMAKPDDADLEISKWDFTRNQGWYNLILAVDPNDTNTLVIGGIDLFRSTNGGSNWSQISKWSNNANLNTLSCSYVHADHHQIAYKPGSSTTCIFGTDGGVFYTASLNTAATSNVISARNKDYNVTQFYKGDISQTSGSSLMLAGSQDNGTHKYTAAGINSTTMVYGGDGAACFISPSNNNKQIVSYVFNNYYYTLNNWGSAGIALINDATTGSFINPADWDDNGPGLFSGKAQGAIYRITLTSGAGTLETVTWTATGKPSALRAEKISTGKSRLFVGTESGKLYRTNDAWATSPSFSDITGTINAGNISDIHSLNAGDTLAVVLSNYGINNIYISTNGGSTWSARDGNLPNQPVWSIVLNPDKIGEAVIATETGVYGTTNIFLTTPVWAAYTEGMGAVKVAQLRYRKSDKTLMAVTHGRGVFTSDAWSKNTPIAYFGVSNSAICNNQTIQLKDSSANDPTQWEWTVSPANHVFVNGTDSASQNPFLRFKQGGSYSITLKATNQLGVNSITRNNIVVVTDTIPGIVTLSSDRDSLCNGDSLTLSTQISPALQGSIINYKWQLGAAVVNNSLSTMKVLPSAGTTYRVTLTSNKACVSPNPFLSNVLSPVVLPIVTPTLSLNVPDGCSGKPLNVSVNGSQLGSSPVYNWFLNDSVLGFSGATVQLSGHKAGDQLYVYVLVPGMCVSPANDIYSDTAIIVIHPTPAAPVVSRNYDTLFATASGTGLYTWYRNGVFSGNGKEYRAPQNGGYRCVYTENNCPSDSSALIVFNSLSVSGVRDMSALWPVPAHDQLHLRMEQEIMAMTIFNMTGARIRSVEKSDCKWSGAEISFSITDLKPGNYLLRVNTADGTTEFRFIKD